LPAHAAGKVVGMYFTPAFPKVPLQRFSGETQPFSVKEGAECLGLGNPDHQWRTAARAETLLVKGCFTFACLLLHGRVHFSSTQPQPSPISPGRLLAAITTGPITCCGKPRRCRWQTAHSLLHWLYICRRPSHPSSSYICPGSAHPFARSCFARTTLHSKPNLTPFEQWDQGPIAVTPTVCQCKGGDALSTLSVTLLDEIQGQGPTTACVYDT